MGRRGPKKQYPVQCDVYLTEAQGAHVDRIAALASVSRAAVIRTMVQDRLDIAEGRYDPYPSFIDPIQKAVLEGGTNA